MILPDANLLIYAYHADDPQHREAKAWWTSLLAGSEAIGVPMAVVMAFLRLTTSPSVFREPLTIEESSAVIRSWFNPPHVRLLSTTPDHVDRFLTLAELAGAGGNLTTDAHLAALALDYRATIHSADADFNRFPGLHWINPLNT